MQKLLLLSVLLLAACDNNSNKQSSNPTNQPNTNTTSGILSAMTQRDAEFFKSNTAEREAVLKKCGEALANNKINSHRDYPECTQALQAKLEIEIITELKGDISVEAFRKNAYQFSPYVVTGAAVKAADSCGTNPPFIPLEHPICKTVIAFARQLKAECKTRACDSDDLFERLHIKE